MFLYIIVLLNNIATSKRKNRVVLQRQKLVFLDPILHILQKDYVQQQKVSIECSETNLCLACASMTKDLHKFINCKWSWLKRQNIITNKDYEC